jgi:Uma2 family endonuclease
MNLVISAPEEVIAPAQLIMRLPPDAAMSADDFFDFCQRNRDLRIERKANGEIIIMSPAGGETGGRNAKLATYLGIWSMRDGRGIAFDSSTGFDLPNGATLSPDAAWVLRERLAHLTPMQKRKFLPLCPDFVIELQSPSDRLDDLKEKMQEYIDNGAQLGWLLAPDTRTAYIYRPGQVPEHLPGAAQLSGDPELPGFVLDLREIWNPGF